MSNDREHIEPSDGDKRYVRRDEKGQFTHPQQERSERNGSERVLRERVPRGGLERS